MARQPEIQIALVSTTLVLLAHTAISEGGLRYSGYIRTGADHAGHILCHVFAHKQPVITNRTLVMDAAEINLCEAGALMVSKWLRDTAAYVDDLDQLPPTPDVEWLEPEAITLEARA